MQNTKVLIEARVSECMEVVRLKFPSISFENPSIHFDIVGVDAGLARYQDWSVHFNLKLAEVNLEHFLIQTVPHEIAHLVDYKKYKGWGHKRTWKHVMIYVFGLKPDRCHNMNITEVKTRKYDTYLYTCKCNNFKHEIKTNKHKKISLEGRNFRCNKCMNRIVFESYVGKT